MSTCTKVHGTIRDMDSEADVDVCNIRIGMQVLIPVTVCFCIYCEKYCNDCNAVVYILLTLNLIMIYRDRNGTIINRYGNPRALENARGLDPGQKSG